MMKERITMKKLHTLLLCVLLCLAFVLTFAACDGNKPDNETTAETTGASAEDTTAADQPDESGDAPEETTAGADQPDESGDAPEETADGPEETQDPADLEYDPEIYVTIRTPEDLMKFNEDVNVNGKFFDDMTVIFLDDIDMTGYVWTPLDGEALYGVTFDGLGHTISNLEIAPHEVPLGTTAEQIGAGFIGIAKSDLYFRDLTFDTVHITAYERAVGCIIGLNYANGAFVDFENVTVANFTADGWMDYGNQSPETDGHPISFRVAGFIGHNLAGTPGFTNCTARGLKLSGFHNLAAFVGYDGTQTVDEYSFDGCHVEDCEYTFSYCLSDSYVIDQPRVFVSVFFNHGNWVDHLEECLEAGNTYSNVTYYDYAADNTAYTPEELRSWSEEEANPA